MKVVYFIPLDDPRARFIFTVQLFNLETDVAFSD
jgi:hypothetical protein